MIKKMFLMFLVVFGLVFGITFCISIQPHNPEVSLIETEAFMAVLNKENTRWALTLNPKYYLNTKAVSIEYNTTEYGIFLISDIIYLPVVASSVELRIAPLDENGNPLHSETFFLEVEHATEPIFPEKSGH